jgi:hypothetical protein
MKFDTKLKELMSEAKMRSVKQSSGTFKGYAIDETLKSVKITIPSFTVTSDLRITRPIYEKNGIEAPQPEVSIEIATFDNDIEDVLKPIAAIAIGEAVNKKLKDLDLDLKGGPGAGGSVAGFPSPVYFLAKD